MEFIKSWKFMMIIFGVVLVAAAALIIYGVATHEEPGLMAEAPRWSRDQFPLRACPHAYVDDPHAHVAAMNAVDRAVYATNARLGFDAFVPEYTGERCDVRVTLGVPAEPGWMDPGGDALLTAGTGGVSCDVRTSNVHGELLDLTLQHELGHCLGLDHDDYEQSIMRPVQRETPDRQLPPWITDHDRELLRGLYAPIRR